MLFSKKGKGVMKWIWAVLVFLIIVSMVILYSPIFFLGAGGGHTGGAPVQQPF